MITTPANPPCTARTADAVCSPSLHTGSGTGGAQSAAVEQSTTQNSPNIEVLQRHSQQIGGVTVSFTVGRIIPVSRQSRKPGVTEPLQADTGQHIPLIDFPGIGVIPDPAFTSPTGDVLPASGHCGGALHHEATAAVFGHPSFHGAE